MKYDTQSPYVASYIIVRGDDGTIAFILRKNTSWLNGYYSLPAGKVEKQESCTAAAVREAKEEIGIDIQPKDLRQVLTVHRFSNEGGNSGMEWIDVFFEVLTYAGTPHNAEPDIHEKLAWFSPEALPEKLTPPVREAIAAICEGKAYIEHGF